MRTPFRRSRKRRVKISATVRRAAAAELPSTVPPTSEGVNPACDQASGDHTRAGRTSANDTVATSATSPCNGWSYCTCQQQAERGGREPMMLLGRPACKRSHRRRHVVVPRHEFDWGKAFNVRTVTSEHRPEGVARQTRSCSIGTEVGGTWCRLRHWRNINDHWMYVTDHIFRQTEDQNMSGCVDRGKPLNVTQVTSEAHLEVFDRQTRMCSSGTQVDGPWCRSPHSARVRADWLYITDRIFRESEDQKEHDQTLLRSI